MNFERIKAEGLAHNSYIIGSRGTAAVVDPRRDVQVYLNLAEKRGINIRYILETHRNEDYVIGSTELSKITGAEILHGPGMAWGYGSTIRDGQEIRSGRLLLTAIHTPGHTPESMSYILVDTATGSSPVMVFTGDTLFVNETGRVDLYGIENMPRMASDMYESIFKKLLPLGDGVIICPAHGAGSVCGLKIGDRDESTLGIERIQNPSLQYTGKDDFIKYKISERPERPPYFSLMEKYNQYGPPLLGRLPAPAPLSPSEFRLAQERGALVVDTSLPAAFGSAHIKGAYSIWLEGLSAFAGWVLPYDKPLILVLEKQADLDQAIRYLIRVGYDNIRGFLKDGIEGWYSAGLPVERLPVLSVQQLKEMLDAGDDLLILDVRDQQEWQEGHIPGSMHIYVGYVEEKLGEIPRDKPIVVTCSIGHRSGLAASILQRAGYQRVFNLLGGITAWRNAGLVLVAR